jgi:hypothetical protein
MQHDMHLAVTFFDMLYPGKLTWPLLILVMIGA